MAFLQYLKLLFGVLVWVRVSHGPGWSWTWYVADDDSRSSSLQFWSVEIAPLSRPILVLQFYCFRYRRRKQVPPSPSQDSFLSSFPCWICLIPPLSPSERQWLKRKELNGREDYVIKQVLTFARLAVEQGSKQAFLLQYLIMNPLCSVATLKKTKLVCFIRWPHKLLAIDGKR